MPPRRPRSPERLGDLGIASLALAALCCAGLPALSALVGGITTAALVGGGVALLLVGVLPALVLALLRARRRRHPRARR